jgi:hypothetical protein
MMTPNTKIQYILALRRVSILNPNYKTTKAILRLLTYYSSGNFDDSHFNFDGLNNNKKADALFEVLQKYTFITNRLKEFSKEPGVYFGNFNIPDEICKIIKHKYVEELNKFKRDKKVFNDDIIKQNQEIDKMADILNKSL